MKTMYYIRILCIFLLYEAKKKSVHFFQKQSPTMTAGTVTLRWKLGCTMIFYKLLAVVNLILYTCALNKVTRLRRETFIHVPLISSEKHTQKKRGEKKKEDMIKCVENTIKVGRCYIQGTKKIHLPHSTVSSS